MNIDGICQAFSSSKIRDALPMVPVTVKQVYDAVPSSTDKEAFTINGDDVKIVVMMGVASEKSVRPTDMSFMLDDGTGRIYCHRWMNDAVGTNEVGILSDGAHVRVHGFLKGFQGKMQVEVLGIRAVINCDEVSCHLLHYHTHIPKVVSKEIHQMVVEYLGQPLIRYVDIGIHINQIAAHLKLPLEKIRTAMACLEEDGMVYSTIDEDHYKSSICW